MSVIVGLDVKEDAFLQRQVASKSAAKAAANGCRIRRQTADKLQHFFPQHLTVTLMNSL